MQPNDPTQEHSAEHAAALRRLRRAQIAEATRIRRVVADNYLLTPAHLRSPCRVAVRAEARQVAMWLMRTRLTWPLPTRNRAFPCARIGRLLGGQDHSTVVHGVAVIAARLVSGRHGWTITPSPPRGKRYSRSRCPAPPGAPTCASIPARPIASARSATAIA